ncbi:N-acetylmuramoyl-L-alanine amidase family protein [Ligilactobacillus saerimneri]|uniref:N-acetylmuramoyl-L-alanine amidase family protein n=1 Tax=Ligilactobacillus saerimneri TaxID=228229 RepID=UPI001EE19B38|nr:hypothetical protein [Ligilactobacillus saerimneri]
MRKPLWRIRWIQPVLASQAIPADTATPTNQTANTQGQTTPTSASVPTSATTETKVQDPVTTSSERINLSSESTQNDTTDKVVNEQLVESKQTASTTSVQANLETTATATEFPQLQDAVEKQKNGYWYLYNTQTNTKYTDFQKLQDERIVYYNNLGQMQYNQQFIDSHWYLFDRSSGAMKTGFQYIPEQDKTVCYAPNGQMQYGWQTIAGKTYYFNLGSGAMAKGPTTIDNETYYFDPDTGVVRGG